MKKGYLSIVGFTLLTIGFISIILKMIGLNLTPLSFLEKLGGLTAFVLKLVLMISGIILMYYDMNKEKWLEENENLKSEI